MRITDSDILYKNIEKEHEVDANGDNFYSNHLYWELDGTSVEELKKMTGGSGGGGGGGTEKTKLSEFENDLGYTYVGAN